MKKVEVAQFPMCQICTKATAMYDGPTKMGPWAYMCPDCMDSHGVGDIYATASVSFQLVAPGEKRRSEDTKAKEIRDAVHDGNFAHAEELIGDGDPAELL